MTKAVTDERLAELVQGHEAVPDWSQLKQFSAEILGCLRELQELRSALTAEAEHAAQLRKALIAARSHIDNLHGEIGRRTYQQEELEVTTAFDGLGDGQFNGDWASIMGIIDAAMEKANG